eukprot:g29100.t1
MGEPNEIAEGVGAINLAGGGFWKTWGEVEEKAPTEMKNPRLVRFSAMLRLGPSCLATARSAARGLVPRRWGWNHGHARHGDRGRELVTFNPDSASSGRTNSTTNKNKHNESKKDDVSGSSSAFSDLDPTTRRHAAWLIASQFIINLGFGVIIPVLPLFAQSHGMGAFGVGVVLSAPAFSRLITNMPFGKVADQYGRRPLMIWGPVGTALGTIGTAAAPSLPLLLAARFLVGVGSGASMSGAQAYMADLTARQPQFRGMLLGLQQTGVSAAFTMGPAVGGWVADTYGYQPAFYAVGLSALLCSFGYSRLPELLQFPCSSSIAQASADSPKSPVSSLPASSSPPSSSSSWMILLQNPDMQAVTAVQLAFSTGIAGLLAVVPLQAAEVWGATAGNLGFLYAVMSALGFVGSPLGGWLSDKFGRGKVMVPALLIAGCGMAGLTQATSYETSLVAALIWGFGNALIMPSLNGFVADIAPPSLRGRAMSINRTAGDLAFLRLLSSLSEVARDGDLSDTTPSQSNRVDGLCQRNHQNRHAKQIMRDLSEKDRSRKVIMIGRDGRKILLQA